MSKPSAVVSTMPCPLEEEAGGYKRRAAVAGHKYQHAPLACPLKEETREIPQLTKQLQAGDIDLDEFIMAVSGLHIETTGVCEWGHSRYSIAQSVFETLDILDHAGVDPTRVVGLPPVDVLTSRPAPVEFVMDNLVTEIIEDSIDLDPVYLESLKGDLTLDRLFELLKTQDYDLPGAAAVVCQEIFATDFENVGLREVAQSSQLPKLVTNINYLTGLQCYLLYRTGFIDSPYIAYAGFDA